MTRVTFLSRCALPLALLAGFAGPSQALLIQSFSANQSFVFPSSWNVAPTDGATMARNADASFLGTSYDLSGVGWMTGTGNTGRVTHVTQISPLHVFEAKHMAVNALQPGGVMHFVGRNNVVTSTRVEQLHQYLATAGTDPFYANLYDNDLIMARVSRGLTATEQVSVYRLLDAPTRTYNHAPGLLMFGSQGDNRGTRIGNAVVISRTISSNEIPIQVNLNPSQIAWYGVASKDAAAAYNPTCPPGSAVSAESGDSGSPGFFTYTAADNTKSLLLAGTHWGFNQLGSITPSALTSNDLDYRGNVTTPYGAGLYNPITPLNVNLRAYGYALKWTLLDNPLSETITSATAQSNALPVTNSTWRTGMPVVASAVTGFSGLSNGTYWIIRDSSTSIRLAASAADARSGSAIAISGTGSVSLAHVNTTSVWTGVSDASLTGIGNWRKAPGINAPAAPATAYTATAFRTFEPAIFDAGSVVSSDRTSVAIPSAVGLRGILFKASGTPGGFTFNGTDPLALDYSGLRNEANATQTFNVPVVLTASQNWEAVNGPLVFNGTISTPTGIPAGSGDDTAHVVVIGGAQNTTLNAALTGNASLAKDDAGTLFLNGNNTYAGDTFIHAGSIVLGSSAQLPATRLRFITANPTTVDLNNRPHSFTQISSEFGVTSNSEIKLGPGSGGGLTVNLSANATYGGKLSGNGTVTKQGGGTWTIGGLLTNGAVTISGGGLVVLGPIASTASPLTISPGSTLVLGGNTSIPTYPFTLDATKSISPGDPVGTLETGAQTWNTGATYVWTINSLSGTAGATTGWDLALIQGSLSLPAATDGITLRLVASSALPGWNPSSASSWRIATATGGITGFAAGKFKVDATGFSATNPLNGGKFSVTQSGNDLLLNFTPYTVGTVALAGNQTWATGDSLSWNINSLSGSAGANPGWDLFRISGNLSVTAGTAGFTLKVVSPVALAGWSNSTPQSWRFASANGTITGFLPNKIQIDASGFSAANPLGGGTFAVTQTGTDLILNFTPYAAPGTTSLVGNQVWADGGRQDIVLTSLTGTAGATSGWTLLAITGDLDLSAGPKGYVIRLSSPGTVSGWSASGTYSWKIASVTGAITGFSPSDFLIDVSGFNNGANLGGNWFVSQSGQDLFLNYTGQTLTWDSASGTSGIQTAGGTWDTATNTWQTAANANVAWSNGSHASFTNQGGGANSGTITVGNGTLAGNLTFASGVNYTLAGGTLTLLKSTISAGFFGNTQTLNATLAGTDGFTKVGSGNLALNADNSALLGNVTLVGNGNVNIATASSLGAAGNGGPNDGALRVGDGSQTANFPTLGLRFAGTFAKSLTLNAGVIDSANANTISSAITVLGSNNFLQANNGTSGAITFTGSVTGSGDFGVNGDFKATTWQGANLTYTGATVVRGAHSLNLSSGTQLPATTVLTVLSASGTANLGTANQQIAALSDTGTGGRVTSSSSINLTLSPSQDYTFSGNLSGSLSLVKRGTGTQRLSATSSYSGSTLIQEGSLLVNGSKVGTGNVTVSANGTLGGTGNVTGNVTVQSAGTLSPGNGPTALGRMGFTSPLTLASGAILAIDLTSGAGGSAGVAFDQVSVNGNTSLGGATLALALSANFLSTAQIGATFPIVALTSGSLSGQFAQGTTTNQTIGDTRYVFGLSYATTGANLTLSAILTRPGIPTGLAVAPSGTAISLTWSAPAGANLTYRILRSVGGAPAQELGTTAATTYLDQNVQAGLTYTYQIVALAGDFAGDPSAAQSATALFPLQVWRQQNFGSISPTVTSANAADPDGDGMNNLLEYALGGDPNAADAPSREPVLSTDANRTTLSLTYTRNLSATDVTLQVREASTPSAASWTPVTDTAISATSTTETRRASIPINPAGSFLRLEVTSP